MWVENERVREKERRKEGKGERVCVCEREKCEDEIFPSSSTWNMSVCVSVLIIFFFASAHIS